MEPTRREPETIERRIGLWDAVSIIVGIIIGVGIFKVPVTVFENVSGPWEALFVWVLGGLLALVGAFCFAELAAAYPRSGGEYVYLTRAYGSKMGFLYAWAQLTVIRPASIAAVAYVFADYAAKLCGFGTREVVILAASSIALLSLINILGVALGKQTQNVLTVAKVLALAAIGVVGILWATPQAPAPTKPVQPGTFAGAMIFALWAYSGWHEAAYVAAEVKKSRRNLPLALLLGTAAVTLIYLLVNGAILVGLGFDVARTSTAVAVDLLQSELGRSTANVISVVVMVSALGAINGMIFTTARIYAAFGEDHSLFASLSHWSRRWSTPVRSLVAGGILSIGFVLGVSVVWGGKDALEKGRDPFDTLVEGTAAVFWLFFFLTGIALFVLRWKDAGLVRPFRVPAYPFLPIIFCSWCGYLVVGSVFSFPIKSLIGLGILLAGLPFCFLSGQPKRKLDAPAREREEVITIAGSECFRTGAPP